MHCRLLSGGHCLQFAAFVGGKTFEVLKFPATFLHVTHPIHGQLLIDTGYGGRFVAATERWPYRLYRLATPTTMAGSTTETLAQAGIQAADIKHILLTHFHADHIGGIADFPNATFHFHADALSSLAEMSAFRQTTHAFLPELIPSWFSAQSHPVREDAFDTDDNFPFKQYDLFGDGSITLINLPGHALGHLGVLIRPKLPNATQKTLLYASDAFWTNDQLRSVTEISSIALRFQHDPRQYQQTLHLLRQVSQAAFCTVFACHAAPPAAIHEAVSCR